MYMMQSAPIFRSYFKSIYVELTTKPMTSQGVSFTNVSFLTVLWSLFLHWLGVESKGSVSNQGV